MRLLRGGRCVLGQRKGSVVLEQMQKKATTTTSAAAEGKKRTRLLAAPKAKQRGDDDAKEQGTGWEKNYNRHVATKPEISWKSTEKEHMQDAYVLNSWHEHQWGMLQLLNKLETVAAQDKEEY